MVKPKVQLLLSYHNQLNEFSVDEVFLMAKDLGFDGIDYVAHLKDLYRTPRSLISKSKQHKFPILGVHIPLWLILFTPSFLFPRVLKNPLSFPQCIVFNVHVSGFTYPLLPFTHKINQFFRLAQKKSVFTTFESNPRLFPLQFYPKITYDPDAFALYCIKNSLPINFDTSHIASFNYNIVEFYKKYHTHIKMIHLSDFKNGVEHLPLGDGALPLTDLLSKMKKTGYSGFISFEIFKSSSHATKEEKKLSLKKSLEMVNKYL